MKKTITKDEFVALLRSVQITESQMQQLHALFEKQHPEKHADFLAYLDIGSAEIARIREASAKA